MLILLVHFSESLHASFPQDDIGVDCEYLGHRHSVLLSLWVSVEETFERTLSASLQHSVALEAHSYNALVLLEHFEKLFNKLSGLENFFDLSVLFVFLLVEVDTAYQLLAFLVDVLSESLCYWLQILFFFLVELEKKGKIICLIVLKQVANASFPVQKRGLMFVEHFLFENTEQPISHSVPIQVSVNSVLFFLLVCMCHVNVLRKRSCLQQTQGLLSVESFCLVNYPVFKNLNNMKIINLQLLVT